MRQTKQIEVDGKKYDGISAFIIATMPKVKRDSQEWKNLWVKFTRRALNPKHSAVKFTGIAVKVISKNSKAHVVTKDALTKENVAILSELGIEVDLSKAGKPCSKCNIPKAFSEFHKDKSTKSGYASRCKVCKNKKGK